MREEITPKIRIRPDGIDVIIRKVVFEEKSVEETIRCPTCGGTGYDDDYSTRCQECAGKGTLFTGHMCNAELVDRKYGLTRAGEWVLVPEANEYPEDCFFTIGKLSVGKDRGPGDIISAEGVYRKLEGEE